MKFQKAILLTVLYYVLLNAIGLWIILIPVETAYLPVFKFTHFINSLITLLFLIAFFVLLKRKDVLKFQKVDFKFCILALFLGISFVYFQSFLNIFYYQEIPDTFFKFDYTYEHLIKLSVITSILIVPITEELFFRNYIQRELTKRYDWKFSVILTSILFAIIHINLLGFFFDSTSLNFHQAYTAFFGGLISGILFYKTKSIIPSIIFHIFWNFTAWIV